MRRKILPPFAFLAVLIFALAAPAFAKKVSVMPQSEFLEYCAHGKLSQVGRGVKRKADVDRVDPQTGFSPLICAAHEQDDPRVIEYLVKKGANIERANFQGLTPLMIAAIYNPRPKITSVLLRLGANPRRSDPLGYNAVTYAARYNSSPSVLARLIEEVGVENTGTNGQTPLMCAAQNGNIKVLQSLLKLGASVTAVDPDGMTPLHFAAQTKNLDPYNELISAGADATKRDKRGRTPERLLKTP